MKGTMYRLVVASSLVAIFGCSKSSTAPAAAVRSAASIGVTAGHIVDASGFTLYTTAAACTGACLTVWPPLDASQAPTAKAGVTQASIALSAGQVTYNGHLLFYFDTDTAPGMTNGSGVNGFTLVAP
jgi:predicted lipoprotein with Yx(FWY)xxD motif